MNLVDRLKRKEEAALLELMNQYGDYLLRMAYLLINDYQRAEEAVQDAFISAFEKINQLEKEEYLKSWLTTITINRCRQQMRKWSFKHIFPDIKTVEYIKQADMADSPETDILAIEQNKNLTAAIHSLDYKYREVITLFYFNELKLAEITALTNIKENTIKSRLKRAKKLLRNYLLEEEDAHNGGKKSDEESIR
ncbi:RNA polymerase sigma factor [Oceanobacillus alkalisoli]|uniref:RNA polymerase sigma factor n=1 Tax=Oceanobacillus alkalisoli TaxID=2925113 RepID=UPI001F11FAE0|nr:sigma-70 family RNA polymerase sigma factor [Oceanobacillus alkalisoli]MCF3943205.1 sigma-70 family RNA polymerase sigma factor [Oceanobacillus alkalisoli]